jgi:hypothetical protein
MKKVKVTTKRWTALGLIGGISLGLIAYSQSESGYPKPPFNTVTQNPDGCPTACTTVTCAVFPCGHGSDGECDPQTICGDPVSGSCQYVEGFGWTCH